MSEPTNFGRAIFRDRLNSIIAKNNKKREIKVRNLDISNQLILDFADFLKNLKAGFIDIIPAQKTDCSKLTWKGGGSNFVLAVGVRSDNTFFVICDITPSQEKVSFHRYIDKHEQVEDCLFEFAQLLVDFLPASSINLNKEGE